MRVGTIAFLFGIVIFLQISTLPPPWLLIFLPIVSLTLFFSGRFQSFHKYILIVFCATVCGFLWTFFHAGMILDKKLDKQTEGETVIITGQVVSLPKIMDFGVRFEFQIDTMIRQDGLRLESPGKVWLSWYQKNVSIQAGEYWRLYIKPKRPYGFSNPGSFDYEAWLFQHHIRATGFVINREQNELLHSASSFSINHYRHLLRDLINKTQLTNFEKNLLSALSLGDRSRISAEQWQVLRKTGTSHLLAISGLHIGLVAGLFFIVGRWIWALTCVLPLQMAAQRFAVLAGLTGAFIYAALAGFSIPTQRALVMLSVWMVALFFNRKHASSEIIAISLLAVLIIDPLAAMDVGFYLSFIAISLITYGMSCRVQTNGSGWRNIWWKWGRVQYLVAIGLLPVLILWFQQYPLLGVFSNIIAVPYISLMVVPLVLLGIILLILVFPLGEWVLQFTGQLLRFLWLFLEYLSHLEFNIWQSASLSPLTFMASMIGVLLLLMPKGIPSRWVGLFWLVPLLLPQSKSPETGGFWLAQLDVGQGLATVIQTQNHSMIYDTGDKFSERFNAADAVIIPFLKSQNIYHPDLLIISHGDRDHIGGSEALLGAYPKMRVLTSIKDKDFHVNVNNCIKGQRWQWDGVTFEMLSPTHSENYLGNNSSCVLKISNGQNAVLLTGDIERPAESRLVREIPSKLSVNLLIAPHHGSKTSSSPAFINAVSPEVVIFSMGYKNRFGFPKQDIISRYELREITMLNTARDGALLFSFEDSEMTFSRYRYENQQFWTSEY